MFEITEPSPPNPALGSYSSGLARTQALRGRSLQSQPARMRINHHTWFGSVAKNQSKGIHRNGFSNGPGLLSRLRPSEPYFPPHFCQASSPWAFRFWHAGQYEAQRRMEQAVHLVGGEGASSTQLQTSGHSQATQQAMRGRLHSKWKTARGMLESTSGVLGFFLMSFSNAYFEKYIYLKTGEIN